MTVEKTTTTRQRVFETESDKVYAALGKVLGVEINADIVNGFTVKVQRDQAAVLWTETEISGTAPEKKPTPTPPAPPVKAAADKK